MKTYQVTLPDETAALVEKMLQDGPWESIDDLFNSSIGTLQEDVLPGEDVSFDYDDVRRTLVEGIETANRNPSSNGTDLVAELMIKLGNERKISR